MIIFILNVIMSSESHPILFNFCHSYANVTESYIFMNVKKNKNILAAGMNRVYFSSQDINQANHQSADNVKQIRPNKVCFDKTRPIGLDTVETSIGFKV